MNNESSFFNENKSSFNKSKKKEFKLQRLQFIIKLIVLLFIVLFKHYKIYILKKFIKVRPDYNDYCDSLDPIKLFNLRLKNEPIIICQNNKSKHICYHNINGNYNDIFYSKDGVICEMENIVLDPSKSNNTNIIYKGPVDNIYRGSPILFKGFLNMECNNNKELKNYSYFYESYFNS